jgi:general secretion pathway protein H
MTPTSADKRRQGGFTLLELLIVLALILLASGLILPKLNLGDNSLFNTELRQAVATLRYARRLAIVDAAPRVASFHSLDPDSPDYAERLQVQQQAPGAATWRSERLGLQFQYGPQEPADSVVRADISFFPEGGSSGGVLTFSLGARVARVVVDPITGRIATALDGEEPDEAF